MIDLGDFTRWTSWPQFTRTSDGVIGDDGCEKTAPENAGGRIETGDFAWSNYEFSCRIQPLSGVMAQLHYRLPLKRDRWYTVDLRLSEGVVSISRGGVDGLKVLHQAPCPLKLGTEYDVRVVAQYSLFEAYVDGRLVVQASDVGQPLLCGQVGLAVWQCRAVFRAPRLRLL